MTTVIENTAAPLGVLRGAEGDLIWIRISVDARHLEDVLEIVAELPFPINPEIRHLTGNSRVEFPAYSERVREVREALTARGFEAGCLEVSGIFDR